ncbi:MAG TPA: serine hydrolase [Candidatus Sulfotelmatobacter sp.]|nr:serine hydrolase [Candidatus Sulfotelmatobacter sp.]
MKTEKLECWRENLHSWVVQTGRVLYQAVKLDVLPGLSSHLCRAVCGGLLILIFCPLGSRAQGPKPVTRKPETKAENVPASSTTTHEMTADDVGAFLDGIMPQQLQREDIAGAVISVVKDGKVLFAKGYGYSDVEKKTLVSPENTLFRPGSISKLFTWTSVMQLVEEGKLDLDRDVNDYLDFKIPATYPKPITLRNIMTHTSGFEETVQELFVADDKDLMPLGAYLKEHLPARIYLPGTTPAYSNYATAVAGYIVQRVSGEDYFDYIDNHIIKPLGMTHSTFRQPLPAALLPLMSKGYEAASQPAKKFEFVEAAPAGSSSVSAMDMTHFMMAHLQDGHYENVQILKPDTARLMHSRQFANLPDMNGMCLGFYEETRNGNRIIGHGGDTQYFHSDLHLIPDAQVGFFVSYNSAGKGEIRGREAVWHAFLDRYFPIQMKDEPPAATAAQDAQIVSGHYISSRRSETNILAVLNVAGEAKIFRNGDGTISASDFKDMSGQPRKFREIGPMMFRDVNDQDRIGFKRDDSGNLVGVVDFPFLVVQRASWWENSAFQLPLIVVSLVIVVLAVVLWPVMALLRKHYAKPLNLTQQQRRLRLLVRLVCIAFIIFFAAYVTFFMVALKDIGMLSPEGNPWLRLIQLFGWLGVLGTLIALYHAMRSWQDSSRWLWSKIGDTLIALACVGVICFVFTWHMLHWSLKY